MHVSSLCDAGCMNMCPVLPSLLHALSARPRATRKPYLQVCTKEGEKVALSRRVEKHWRLIGWGQIQKGLKMELPPRPSD